VSSHHQQETDNVTEPTKRKRVHTAPRQVQKTFTTGQIAKRCSVAPRTASKWIDRGHLKGWRIPGSKDRRVYREDLIAFLKANEMKLGDLETEATPRVLLVAVGGSTRAALTHALTGCDVRCSADGFAAGLKVSEWRPDVVVVDLSMGSHTALTMARAIRGASGDDWRPTLVALYGDDGSPVPLVSDDGFDAGFSQGDTDQLTTLIRASVEAV
jgi:excisionase family DNA binding protein